MSSADFKTDHVQKDLDSASTDILNSNCHILQQEQPKISEAVKNLISLLLGLSSTASSTDVETGTRVLISMDDALSCAKTLLQAIQLSAKSLPDDPSQWGSIHAQKEQQSASNRLDEIIDSYFKCCGTYRWRSSTSIRSSRDGSRISCRFGKIIFNLIEAYRDVFVNLKERVQHISTRSMIRECVLVIWWQFKSVLKHCQCRLIRY